MDHYNIYFRENSDEKWFGFGSCFSEKGAKTLLANYMYFRQNEGKNPYGVVGYILLHEGEKYDQIVANDDPRIVTLENVGDINRILNEGE